MPISIQTRGLKTIKWLIPKALGVFFIFLFDFNQDNPYWKWGELYKIGAPFSTSYYKIL
jgi:hypothetical protein